MYERLYAGRAYVTRDVVVPVRARVRELASDLGVADRRATPIRPASEAEAAVQLAFAWF